MKIDDFCSTFGGAARSINAVAQEWHVVELDRMLAKLDVDATGSAVIIGDSLHGDGIRDQIPRELKDAFHAVYKTQAHTYREMRETLLEHIQDENGEFFSFDDRRVQGFVSKLKGQLGENTFKRHAGAAAELAKSGSQKGWDVAITHDGTREYVQVKIYKDPADVIREMRKVNEGILSGSIAGVDGEVVESISFAVPENIAADIHDQIADRYPELIDIKIHTVSTTAGAAGKIVEEGLSSIGPGELAHLFDELLCGTLAAASLHALANGFLWYKGAKDFSDAYVDTVANTTLSAAGVGIGLLAETLSNSTPLSAAIAIGGRAVLSRFARSRWNFADFLEQSIEASQSQVAALQRFGTREHSIDAEQIVLFDGKDL